MDDTKYADSMGKEKDKLGSDSCNEPLDLKKVHHAARPKDYRIPPYARKHLGQLSHSPECKSNFVHKNSKQSHIAATHYVRYVDSRSEQTPKLQVSIQGKQGHMKLNTHTHVAQLNKSYFEKLLQRSPEAVADEFHKRHEDFITVMKTCRKDGSLIPYLFSVLAKVTSAVGNHVQPLGSALRESAFMEKVVLPHLLSLMGDACDNINIVRNVLCVLRYTTENSYTSVASFFGVLTVLSDLIKKILASDHCTPELADDFNEFDHIRSNINKMRRKQKKRVRTSEDEMLPPDSFRNVNIIPTADELLSNTAPFLRKNKTFGSYKDLDHYLDVQFRLIREDFVEPFRESIQEFKANLQTVQDGKRKVQDIRVYDKEMDDTKYADSMGKEKDKLGSDSCNEPLDLKKVHHAARPKDYRIPPYARKHLGQLSHSPECKSNFVHKNSKQSHIAATHYVRYVDSRSEQTPKLQVSIQGKQGHMKLNTHTHVAQLNKSYFEKLLQRSPEAVADEFHKRHEDFITVMKTCRKDGSLIPYLFSVLAKVTSAVGNHVQPLGSALRESAFMEKVVLPHLLSLMGDACDNINIVRNVLCVLRYTTENSYTSVASFFGVLTVLSDLIKKILASDHCTPELADDFNEFDHIRSNINKMRRKQKKRVRTSEDEMLPPDSFRNVNIIPTADELLSNTAPFLRKNKTFGSYKDLDHYLDVQFRLIREDFVEPFRESIQEFKANLQTVQDGKRKVQDIRVYDKVNISGTTTTCDGICHILTFDTFNITVANWQNSKRLLNGSLLCLSYDTFQTIYLATVSKRHASELALGVVEVKFACGLETVRAIANKQFVMVESPMFFEAYKHNLTALQSIKELPFSEYIIECEEDIKPPAYLRNMEDITFDLSVLGHENDKINTGTEKDLSETVEKKLKRKSTGCKINTNENLENVNILAASSWPSKSALGLDESQYRALKNSLTNEFSITQGPPGTGKTYIGLKVARVLLANKCVWSCSDKKQPLLVVCYTNHALDQFLSGIQNFYEGAIVRVGGGSTNEDMKRRGIKTMYKYITSEVREASNTLHNIADDTEKRINELKDLIYRTDREIIKTDQLIKFMGRFKKSLKRGFQEKLSKINQFKGDNAKLQEDQLDAVQEWLECSSLPVQQNIKVCFDCNFSENNMFPFTDVGKKQELNKPDLETTNAYYKNAGCISKQIILSDKEIKQQSTKSVKPTQTLMRCVSYKDLLPMSETLQQKIRDVWTIKVRQRWELYKSWVEQFKLETIETLEEYEEFFEMNCQEIKESTQQKHIQALQQADVVGMTTTGAAKHYEVLKSVKPKIVIVEEAAEVLEGHIITSLSEECEHLILIGDHKQLRPSPAVYKLAKKYKLDISLFERMINNKVKYESLEHQHRMRPEISQIIRLFYENLKDHELVFNRPDVRGISYNVYFVTHTYPEDEEEDSTSHLNKHEAQFMVALCGYLLKQEYEPTQITILTTYTAQMFYIRRLLPKELHGISVNVVDNFQGEESDIILLSLVRSNSRNKVGFLKTENRVNVALSRARQGLYVIGNLESFAKASNTWAEIVDLLRKENHIGPTIPLYCRNHNDRKLNAGKACDFDSAPEGGCNVECDTRLDCGHVCVRKCHVFDIDHKEYKCMKPCTKMCQNGHTCLNLCSEKCDECIVSVTKIMPICGHEQTMLCFEESVYLYCKASCERKCSNNHVCKKFCFETCGDCQVEITKNMPGCGHKQLIPCFRENSWECQAPCEDILECEHKCQAKCSDANHDCSVEIELDLEKCGHTVKTQCYKRNKIINCDNPCDLVLECGHKCAEKCYEEHTRYCQEIIFINLEKCGHSARKYCYKRNLETRCRKPCEYLLKCGHKCMEKCYKPHTWSCGEIVTVTLEKCGHSTEKECYKRTETINCEKPCEFTLECGHKCKRKCFEPHTSICQEKVLKQKSCGHSVTRMCYIDVELIKCMNSCEVMLACGHKCRERCCEPHTSFCKTVVKKTLKCGHVKELYCGVDLGVIKCSGACKTKLACGHTCNNTCSQPHTKDCLKEADYECNYRHKTKVSCYQVHSGTAKCSFKCQRKLACGHFCRSSCYDCSGGTLHKACSSCPIPEVKYHISAMHKSTEEIPCLAACQNRCAHKRCDKLCFEPCSDDGTTIWPCKENCNSECDHYYCRKRCFEPEGNLFCSETYDLVQCIAETSTQPDKLRKDKKPSKSKREMIKFHKTCGAPIDTGVVETVLKCNERKFDKDTGTIAFGMCIQVASKLHEYQERKKLKSKFYIRHSELQKRFGKLDSQLHEMNQGGDLFKIFKERLEERFDDFKSWIHFQKQGYKDLIKEIERLERMAMAILSKQKREKK